METNNSIRLWRVLLVHRNGYQAPSQMIECKKSEVHTVVRKLNLRLLDFPEKWSYHLIDLKKEFNSRKGKWI